MMKQFESKSELFTLFIDLHNLKRLLKKYSYQGVEVHEPVKKDLKNMTERELLKREVCQVVTAASAPRKAKI